MDDDTDKPRDLVADKKAVQRALDARAMLMQARARSPEDAVRKAFETFHVFATTTPLAAVARVEGWSRPIIEDLISTMVDWRRHDLSTAISNLGLEEVAAYDILEARSPYDVRVAPAAGHQTAIRRQIEQLFGTYTRPNTHPGRSRKR